MHFRRLSLSWSPIIWALLMHGCAHQQGILKWPAPERPGEAAAYKQVLREWTRHEQIIEKFITVADVQAIFRSWPVRSAWIRELAARQGIQGQEVERLRTAEAAAFGKSHEFILTLYSDKPEWNELDASDSVWSVTLQNDQGDRVSPISIEPAEISSADRWVFYPGISPWSKTYSVKFPAATVSGKPMLSASGVSLITLSLRSTAAQVALEWRLEVCR